MYFWCITWKNMLKMQAFVYLSNSILSTYCCFSCCSFGIELKMTSSYSLVILRSIFHLSCNFSFLRLIAIIELIKKELKMIPYIFRYLISDYFLFFKDTSFSLYFLCYCSTIKGELEEDMFRWFFFVCKK